MPSPILQRSQTTHHSPQSLAERSATAACGLALQDALQQLREENARLRALHIRSREVAEAASGELHSALARALAAEQESSLARGLLRDLSTLNEGVGQRLQDLVAENEETASAFAAELSGMQVWAGKADLRALHAGGWEGARRGRGGG